MKKILSKLWRLKVIQKVLPDKWFYNIEFYAHLGYKINWKNPQTYNEKLHWLKLNDRQEWYKDILDKEEVKKYISMKVGEKYINKTIQIYNDFDEINFMTLPNEYVIKTTHDSGSVYIKRKGDIVNISDLKKRFNKSMKKNYFTEHREWGYKKIKPRIIIEELFLVDDKIPKDYKIFCFDGEPKFFFIASDRGISTKFDFFDINWNKIPVQQYYPNSNYKFEKLKNWDEVIHIVKEISKEFKHVRVDLYTDENRIKIGELTLYHFGGIKKFNPPEYDKIFGEYIKLDVK